MNRKVSIVPFENDTIVITSGYSMDGKVHGVIIPMEDIPLLVKFLKRGARGCQRDKCGMNTNFLVHSKIHLIADECGIIMIRGVSGNGMLWIPLSEVSWMIDLLDGYCD